MNHSRRRRRRRRRQFSRQFGPSIAQDAPNSASCGLRRPTRPSRNHHRTSRKHGTAAGHPGRAFGPVSLSSWRPRRRRRGRLRWPVDQTASRDERDRPIHPAPGGVNLFLIVSTDERLMTCRVSSGRCGRRRTGHNGRVPAGKPGSITGRRTDQHRQRPDEPLISRREIFKEACLDVAERRAGRGRGGGRVWSDNAEYCANNARVTKRRRANCMSYHSSS